MLKAVGASFPCVLFLLSLVRILYFFLPRTKVGFLRLLQETDKGGRTGVGRHRCFKSSLLHFLVSCFFFPMTEYFTFPIKDYKDDYLDF